MTCPESRKRNTSTGCRMAVGLLGLAGMQDAVADVLQEVTVTATRRAGNLQETGATVSAFTAESMAMRSMDALEDISSFSPGLHIAGYQSDVSIMVRGIGTPAIIAGNDNSIGTYVDGVFYSRASAIGPAFFDVDRIEVLRGPQGTLYGRNATGGAVNVILKAPTANLEREVRAAYGNYSRARLYGAVSGPLTERLRARVAVQYENRDGYTDLHRPAGSLLPDEDVEDKNDISVRVTLQADLGDQAMLTLTGDYFHADDQANVFHYASAGYADEIPGWYGTREGMSTAAYFAFKGTGRATGARSRDIYSDVDYRNRAEIWGLTGKLDWNIGDHDLKIIANYKSTNPSLQNEFDLADAFVNVYQREEDHWQRSTEFQLSSPDEGRFSWILGGYWFEERNEITNNIFGDFWEPILVQGLTDLQLAGVLPPFPVVIPQTTLCCDLHLNGEQQTEAWAVYLDTAVGITDQLTLKVGGRYSHEERDGRQAFDLTMRSPTGGADIRFAPEVLFFPNAVSDSRDGVTPDPFGFVVAPVIGPASFDSFTPKVGLDLQMSDKVLLYATIQKGFKSGGYNIGSSQRVPFEPESIWAYEAGVKSDLADGRVRINVAAFHYDYKNLQAQDSVQNQPIIRNVGKAKVDGVEIETLAVLTDNFQIDATATYLDARFTQGELTEPLRPAPLTQAPGTVLRDLDGLRLPRAPEWKFNVGAQAQWPVRDKGEVALRVDYGWQSRIFYTVFNLDAASQGSYGLLNARLQYTPDHGNWTIALSGKNLGDEAYFANQILTGSFYGAEFVGSLGAPRTYGVELSMRF